DVPAPATVQRNARRATSCTGGFYRPLHSPEGARAGVIDGHLPRRVGNTRGGTRTTFNITGSVTPLRIGDAKHLDGLIKSCRYTQPRALGRDLSGRNTAELATIKSAPR